VGIISGWIVDKIGGPTIVEVNTDPSHISPFIGKIRVRDIAYVALAAPALVVGAAQLAQIEIEAILGVPIEYIALTGTVTGLFIWSFSPLHAMTNPDDAPVTRAAEETSFISVWVIGAYLAYDYLAAYAGLDLMAAFSTIAPLLPLIAILIGFIPGCGPQVLVTTLYINGVVPFAALIGNAISNDGDALFPAIALTPRAAIVATLYSAIPALIVSYGFYFLAPGFMN
jgi:hypothetical protein